MLVFSHYGFMFVSYNPVNLGWFAPYHRIIFLPDRVKKQIKKNQNPNQNHYGLLVISVICQEITQEEVIKSLVAQFGWCP